MLAIERKALEQYARKVAFLQQSDRAKKLYTKYKMCQRSNIRALGGIYT